jgi:flagellar hook-associated protein 2
MATATSSIGGLVSGLDTATIISQLMQVEAQTQTNLKSRVSTEQSTVKSLQDLNAKLAALTTSAGALAKSTGWNPLTVTSSSANVSVTAGPSAQPGSFSFTVGQLARAHSLTFTSTAANSTVVTTGSTKVHLDRLDGTTLDIETGDGTLAGLVKGINAASTGLQAGTVKLDDGTYRLSVTSLATGGSSDFTLTNLDGSALLGGATVVAGQDASITVGADVLHSATNTFSQVVNGLDVTLKGTAKAGEVVDVTATTDADTMAASVQAMVDAVNGALDAIDKLTAYNDTTKSAGALASDGATRSVRSSLFDTVYPTDGSTMASVGIQTDRYGKLVFNADTFKAAYAKDPASVAAAFTTSGTTKGFAARVQAVADDASNSVDGTVTAAIKGRNDGIKRMQDDIANWDTRLALRQETLTRQFTALETTLSQLQSQGSWLASQVASLSPSSSSSKSS